jgi:acyl carrier protein
MNSIAGKLEQLARDALSQCDLRLDVERLDPSKGLVTQYGLTSVGLIKLVMEIESAFNVAIRDEDLNADNFDSLNTIRELLEGQYLVASEAAT